MIDKEALGKRIVELAYLTGGEFLLRSGKTSDKYFDKFLFTAEPKVLNQITRAMCDLLPQDVDILAGLELGAIPLVTMLSQHTGLPSLFVRKEAKPYGTAKLAEGGDFSGKNMVIVEDVVTSGGQVLESARELRERGAKIKMVICVIDRESGGAENLRRESLPFRPLFKMSELLGSDT